MLGGDHTHTHTHTDTDTDTHTHTQTQTHAHTTHTHTHTRTLEATENHFKSAAVVYFLDIKSPLLSRKDNSCLNID